MPCGSQPPALPLPGAPGRPRGGAPSNSRARGLRPGSPDCRPALAGAGLPPLQPSASRMLRHHPGGSHGPEVPVGPGSPAPWGLGTAATPSRCVPTTRPGPPSVQRHPGPHLLQEDPTLLPGWLGRASSRGPLLERVSGVRGAAAPDSHERGRGCHCRQEGWGLLPSNRQGGSSQEGEAARKKAAPHGKHLPARPQEDPRKHKACSRMFT